MPLHSLLAAVLCGLIGIAPVTAHLAAYTDGMYCRANKYQGPLKNMTDHNPMVFDPLYQLSYPDWFLSRGRNCLNDPPTGTWIIKANSIIQVPWATSQNSFGYYADGKEQNQHPIPYSTTNPEVIAKHLVSASGGLNTPNLHCGNKSTAAGTAIGIAYKADVWDIKMEDIVVISVAGQTPFERIANYEIPNLAPCEECHCITGWVPKGYGQQNMYMAAHKCKIVNNSGTGKKPKTPSKFPGPGVKGSKQMIAAFQLSGNNYNYTRGKNQVPTYSPAMGYLPTAQTDIF